MSDINVPVVGKVKSTYVYVGGALVVGIVGYAWFSRSRQPTVIGPDPGDVSLPEGTPPTVVDSNLDGTGTVDVIDTNSEWSQKAVEYLVGLGFDAQFAGTALGKYLARRPLTTQEQDVVLAAVAGLDQPPVGRPYTIMSTPVPVPDPPKPKPPTPAKKPQYVTTGRWAPPHPVSYTWMAGAGLIRPSGKGWVLTGKKLGPNGTTDRRHSGVPVSFERLEAMQLIRKV